MSEADQPANLRADAFVGAAAAYARYRPPYPRAMLDDLLARAAIGPGARLLDLACGPGRIALDLAPSFETVSAIDLEPEMIEVGKVEAARRGVGNVTWFVGRAEDLDAPPGAFDLITIGEAFHRLDQAFVARKAIGWLKSDGCLATTGGGAFLTGREPWRKALAEVARRWMARAFPGGWGEARAGNAPGPENQSDVLRAAGFVVSEHHFDVPHTWTFEELVGYLQSTSVCSRHALGDDFDAFEADLRKSLGASDTSTFHETLNYGYTLARKPTLQPVTPAKRRKPRRAGAGPSGSKTTSS